MQNGESFFAEKHGKIAHGINFAPKSIPAPKNIDDVQQCHNSTTTTSRIRDM